MYIYVSAHQLQKKPFQDGDKTTIGTEKQIYVMHLQYHHRHLVHMAVHDVADQISHEALLLE